MKYINRNECEATQVLRADGKEHAPMPEFTEEQRRIAARLDRALKDATRAGLSLRVFDGAVLLLRSEALEDRRYGEFGSDMVEWTAEHAQQVGIGMDADGGAGQ